MDKIMQGHYQIRDYKSQDFERLIRVYYFTIEILKDDSWQEVSQGTTIGHKRIVKLDQPVEAGKLRVNITSSRACPVISNVEIY